MQTRVAAQRSLQTTKSRVSGPLRNVTAHGQAVAATTQGKLSTKLVPVQGTQLELISTPPQPEHPPLLFLHGAGHAAWCWAEHFMPWLAEQGLECHALSFRGHVRTHCAIVSSHKMV